MNPSSRLVRLPVDGIHVHISVSWTGDKNINTMFSEMSYGQYSGGIC